MVACFIVWENTLSLIDYEEFFLRGSLISYKLKKIFLGIVLGGNVLLVEFHMFMIFLPFINMERVNIMKLIIAVFGTHRCEMGFHCLSYCIHYHCLKMTFNLHFFFYKIFFKNIM